MRNDYQERRRDRIARLKARAEKKDSQGEALTEAGRQALALIPFGQPLLVGHYSYNRDRRYRERSTGKIIKGIELQEEAQRLKQRAASAQSNTAVNSDDSDAVTKLKEKIAGALRCQEAMKAANAIIKKAPKNQPTPEKIAKLIKLGLTEHNAQEAFKPDCCRRIGFPAYALQNNNANIRRMQQRLRELEQLARRADQGHTVTLGVWTIDGMEVTAVESYEKNRLQITFSDKPQKALCRIMRHSGFVYSPHERAWQRKIGNSARYQWENALQQIQKIAQVSALNENAAETETVPVTENPSETTTPSQGD